MRNFVLGLFFVMAMIVPCHAGTATVMSSQSISTDDTVYSSSTSYSNAAGFSALDIDLGAGGGEAGVTITQQCSTDGTTWRDCYDTDGDVVGEVCSSLTSDRYIEFSPVITNKIRFKVVAGATVDTVTLKHVWKEN